MTLPAKSPDDVVVLDALRTPIGKARGSLARVRPDDLAAHVLRGLLERNPTAKAALEEIILGATNQAGEDNRNIARMAALLADLPYEVTGVTVNRLCGSGLEAVIQSARAIHMGDHEVMVAGGVESMSRAPYAYSKPDEAFPRKPPTVYDTSLGWRFQNPAMAKRFPLIGMGMTAENVAAEYGVSRADQDAFAASSHQKAAAAWEAGAFADEVIPVTVPPAHRKAQPTTVERDECIRPDSTAEALAKLRPVFKEDGSVTAGNSSPLNDGAAVVLMTTRRWAEENGAKPIARFLGSASAGVHPNVMGIGPIPSTRKVLGRLGLSAADLDVVELNEAFAAQSLACVRELELDPAKVNVLGGAIALGHPIGCSGARIVGTLMNAMRRQDATLGLATLCIGVGQGLAAVFERES
ncbi:MAG: acetyl-CoA C-acyltransferase [Sandaracinus sp.]|nr:acetyl-CoA C-acyltransferase [Sandaracinus sp.]